MAAEDDAAATEVMDGLLEIAEDGDENPSPPTRSGRGLLGWLRSFGFLSLIGAGLAVSVLLIGVSSLLARPGSWQSVLPFQPDPVPSLAEPTVVEPTASASETVAAVDPVRATASPSSSPSVAPLLPATPSASPSRPGPPAPPVSRFEAESALLSQALPMADHPGFSGQGFVDYLNTVGGFVEWTVTSAKAGPVTVRFRYANGSGGPRPMDILLNGALAADELAFGATPGWDRWEVRTVTLTLAAGTNRIRAVATAQSGGPNVDYLEIVR